MQWYKQREWCCALFILALSWKRKGRDERSSAGRIKKRAVLMTFNFNYNMLCCVCFFVLYPLQTSTSSLNYFR